MKIKITRNLLDKGRERREEVAYNNDTIILSGICSCKGTWTQWKFVMHVKMQLTCVCVPYVFEVLKNVKNFFPIIQMLNSRLILVHPVRFDLKFILLPCSSDR